MSKELIKRKLEYLKENLIELKERKIRLETEKNEFDKKTLKLASSKLIEEIIEAAIKINNTFLLEKNKYANTYYESFIRLGEIYDIEKDLLLKLAKTTSYRNKVVHEYELFDKDEKLLNVIKEILEYYEKYVKEIKKLI